jgi:hypothetical protein
MCRSGLNAALNNGADARLTADRQRSAAAKAIAPAFWQRIRWSSALVLEVGYANIVFPL